MRQLAALALVLSAVAVPAAAQERSYSWERVRALAPEALALELFGEVGRTLYLDRFQVPEADDRLVLPLRGLVFHSRPRASYRAGVCETDRVTVRFEPAPFAAGGEFGLQPYRLALSTQFIVQDPDKVREGGPSVDEMAALEAACAAIDPREVTPITAETAFDVTGTIGLLADLVDAAREARVTSPLECRDQDGMAVDEGQCLRDLARLRVEDAYSASLSPDCDRGEAEVYCRTALVHGFDNGVAISFEVRRGEGKPLRVVVAEEMDLSVVQ